MVGDHQRDLGVQRAGAPAEDQVVQAMPGLGDHQQGAGGFGVADLEAHVETLGNGLELLAQLCGAQRGVAVERGAQVHLAVDGVVKLLVLADVQRARQGTG